MPLLCIYLHGAQRKHFACRRVRIQGNFGKPFSIHSKGCMAWYELDYKPAVLFYVLTVQYVTVYLVWSMMHRKWIYFIHLYACCDVNHLSYCVSWLSWCDSEWFSPSPILTPARYLVTGDVSTGIYVAVDQTDGQTLAVVPNMSLYSTKYWGQRMCCFIM